MKLRGFTLLELLIVMGIIVVLSGVVVSVLNPVELLRKARDTRRLQEIDAINNALLLYQVEYSNGFFGTSSTVYVSIPDSSSTCSNLGLPTLPYGYTYYCSGTSTYRNVDGSGWIPVNFKSIAFGSPLVVLPIDPVNTTSTGNYYTYIPGGSWELTAVMEATVYRGQNTISGQDSGSHNDTYEKGTNLTLTPTSILSRSEDTSLKNGLVAWYAFDETSGVTASDLSGNGNSGTLVNNPIRQISNCKMRGCLVFGGSGKYVDLGAGKFDTLSEATIALWFKYTGAFVDNRNLINHYKDSNNRQPMFVSYPGGYGNKIVYEYFGLGLTGISTTTIGAQSYYHVVNVCGASGAKLYVNGLLEYASTTFTSCLSATAPSTINTIGSNFVGQIDDVRIYNRGLSASEIQSLYNATK